MQHYFPPFFPFSFFYLGTRQSALWRVVASSSKREAMSFPCGTETKVYIIFSPAWRFFFEAGRSPSLCWLGTRVICLHQGLLQTLQLPPGQGTHLSCTFSSRTLIRTQRVHFAPGTLGLSSHYSSCGELVGLCTSTASNSLQELQTLHSQQM